MPEIDDERISKLLPNRSQRKAIAKHMEHLSNEIEARKSKGESTQVMRIAFNALGALVELSDIVRASIDGGKNGN